MKNFNFIRLFNNIPNQYQFIQYHQISLDNYQVFHLFILFLWGEICILLKIFTNIFLIIFNKFL